MEGEKRVDKERERKRKKKRKTKTGGRRKNKWSVLSEDIISLILQRLTLLDRIRFSLTCKNWRSASTSCHVQRKLPWIMEFPYPKTKPTVCLLYEPYLKRPDYITERDQDTTPYIVKDEKLAKADLFSGATLCASRFGWLFLSKTVYKGFKITYFYVYNPLSKQKIPLPRFKWLRRHRRKGLEIKYATFTSVPTCPECVFILAYHCKTGEIFIGTFSNGGGRADKKLWNTRIVTPPNEYYFSGMSRITYMKGTFYCFGKKGWLSSFNFDTGEWNTLSEGAWDVTLSRKRPYNLGYFLGYGGNLFLVEHGQIMTDFNSDDPEYSVDVCGPCFGICHPRSCHCMVYRFNWLHRIWEKMETLEGGIIFLDPRLCRCSFGMSAEELRHETEQTKTAANRIYYFSSSFYLTPGFHVYGAQKDEERAYRDMICWDTPIQDYGDNKRIWLESPLLIA